MFPPLALLLLSSFVSSGFGLNSTIPSNSTSNSTAPIVVICPTDWFSNDNCVLATNLTDSELDLYDETQCTRAHSSLYLCLSHPTTSSVTYPDEIEELLDDDDYY